MGGDSEIIFDVNNILGTSRLILVCAIYKFGVATWKQS